MTTQPRRGRPRPRPRARTPRCEPMPCGARPARPPTRRRCRLGRQLETWLPKQLSAPSETPRKHSCSPEAHVARRLAALSKPDTRPGGQRSSGKSDDVRQASTSCSAPLRVGAGRTGGGSCRRCGAMGDDVVAAARQASLLFHAGRFDEALAVLADVKQRRSDDPKARLRVARTRRQSGTRGAASRGLPADCGWPAASRRRSHRGSAWALTRGDDACAGDAQHRVGALRRRRLQRSGEPAVFSARG